MSSDKQFNYNQHKKSSTVKSVSTGGKLAEIPNNPVSKLYTATYTNFRRTHNAFIFRFFFIIILLVGTLGIFGALVYRHNKKPAFVPPVNPSKWYNNFYQKFSTLVKEEINSINTQFEVVSGQLPTRSAFGYYNGAWFPKVDPDHFKDNPNLAMRPSPNAAGCFDYQSTSTGLFSVDQMDEFGIPGMTDNQQSTGTQTTPYLSTITSVVLIGSSNEQTAWEKNVKIEPIYNHGVSNSAYVYAKILASTYNGTADIVNYLRFMYHGVLPQQYTTSLPPLSKVSDFEQADYQMTGKNSEIINEKNYAFKDLVSKFVEQGWTQQLSPVSNQFKPGSLFSGLSFANFGDPFTDSKQHHNYWFFYSSNHLNEEEYNASKSFFKIRLTPLRLRPTKYAANNDYKNVGFYENEWSGPSNQKIVNDQYQFIDNSANADKPVYQAYQNFFKDYGYAGQNKQNDISLNLITNSKKHTYFHDLNNSIYRNPGTGFLQNQMDGFTGKVNNADLGSAFSSAFSQAPADKISYKISYGSPDGSYKQVQENTKNDIALYHVKKGSFLSFTSYDVYRQGLANKFWTMANLNRFIANQPVDPNQHKNIIPTNNLDFKPSPSSHDQGLFGYENNADMLTDFTNSTYLDNGNKNSDKRFLMKGDELQNMLATSHYYLDVISSCTGNDPDHSGKTYTQVIYRIPLTIFLLPAYNYTSVNSSSPFYNDRYSFGIGFDRAVLTEGSDADVSHPIINNSSQSFAYQGGELPNQNTFRKLLTTDTKHNQLKLTFSNFQLSTVYVSESLGLFV